MYIYIYIYIYVYMYMCSYLSTYSYIYVYVYIFIYVIMFISTFDLEPSQYLCDWAFIYSRTILYVAMNSRLSKLIGLFCQNQ